MSDALKYATTGWGAIRRKIIIPEGVVIVNGKAYGIVWIIGAMLFCGACAAKSTEEAALQQDKEQQKEERRQERQRTKKLFEDIQAQSGKTPRTPETIKESYRTLKITKLNDVPEQEYSRYQQFAANGEVYFIVHPAYFAFFQEDKLPVASPEDAIRVPEKNYIERFAEKAPAEVVKYKVFLEQERLQRDFIRYAAYSRRLVILILPGDYEKHLSYGMVPGVDEYTRYLNEITGGGESLLYLSSVDWATGHLTDGDRVLLTSFLRSVGAHTFLLGGGYVGRCVDNFYLSLRKDHDRAVIFFVPELLAVSPEDKIFDAVNLISRRNRINFKSVIKHLSLATNIISYDGGLEPQVKRFDLYSPYY